MAGPAPQIPYSPVPDVTPEERTRPTYFDVRGQPQAFGAGVGAELERQGAEVGQAFGAIALQRAQQNNELWANEASTRAMDGITNRFSQFQNLQGLDAINGLDKFKGDIEGIYQKSLEAAPNPMARARLSTNLRYITDSYHRYATNYADQQRHEGTIRGFNDNMERWANEAALAVNDPQTFNEMLRRGANEAATFARWRGMGEDEQTAEIAKYHGRVIPKIIGDLVKQGDIARAEAVYHSYGRAMDPAGRYSAETILAPALMHETGSSRADEIFSGAKPGPLPDTPGFAARVGQAESGGNPAAVNPSSTAAGLHQYLLGTWLASVKQHAPDLARGRTDEQIAALRTDPAISTRIFEADTAANAKEFSAKGIAATEPNLYLAHFLGGIQAAAVIKAEPGTPLTSLLPNKVLQANPAIADLDAGGLQRWAAGKLGVTLASTGAEIPSPAALSPTQPPPIPDRGDMWQRLEDRIKNDPPGVKAAARAELRSRLEGMSAAWSDHERAQKLAKEQAQADSDHTEFLVMQNIHGDHPTITAQDVVKIPEDKLSREGRERLLQQINTVGQQQHRDFGPGFDDAFARMRLPLGDPNRIENVGQLSGLVNQPNGISFAGAEKLEPWIAKLKKPEGYGEANEIANFLATAKREITGANDVFHIRDSKGDRLYQSFLTRFYAEYQGAAADPSRGGSGVLLDPQDDKSLWSLAKPFIRTPTQRMADLRTDNPIDEAITEENRPPGSVPPSPDEAFIEKLRAGGLDFKQSTRAMAIRGDYLSGKITREEARQRLEAEDLLAAPPPSAPVSR